MNFKHCNTVKFPLCLGTTPRNYVRGVEANSTLDGGKSLVSRSDHFSPEGVIPVTHGMGIWVGPEPVAEPVAIYFTD